MSDDRPKVGVGLMIMRGNQVLLSKRKGSHGEGEYAAVGGHIEHGETFEEAVLRELREECGPRIKVKNLRQVCVINLRTYKPKHFIDIGFVAEWDSGEPQLTEPHKFEGWEWFDKNNLPSPIFVADPLYLEAVKTGKTYFDCP